MVLQEYKIIFDDPLKTYFPGQTVTGKVVVVLDSPKRFRAIKIEIKGEANTFLSLLINNQESRYTGHEKYFLIRKYLVGSAFDRVLELSPGEHVYPFEYVLPTNLPSSFESNFGHVRYTVQSTIDRPQKFGHETIDAFTVVSYCDLNTDPRASEPVIMEESTTFGCFCITPPLTVNFSLPVRGYVSGQSIPIKVHIENESGVDVYAVRVSLIKYVTYRVSWPRKFFKTIRIVIVEENKLIEDSEIEMYEQLLKIPPLRPSNLENCGIIDIEYKLKLKAFVDRSYCSNFKISTNILIGTVPLVNYQSLASTPDPSGGMEIPMSTASTGDPPDYFSVVNSSTRDSTFTIPPPSYEESILAALNLQDSNGSQQVRGIRVPFAPRYPVYNNYPST